MSESHVAIAVRLLHLFGVDQDQAPYSKKGKLLDNVGPQTPHANDGNVGRCNSILSTLAEEASIAIIPRAIRNKG